MLKEGPNGYLYAPARGTPPECPAGYEPAPGNKYLFLPKLEACNKREVQTSHSRCCGPIVKLVCLKTGEYVTRLNCRDCQLLGD